MELSRNDTKILKGIAILLMVMLHLFARKEVDGLYSTFPSVNGVPLLYYLALLGDACRPIYLFVSGYAFYIMINKEQCSVMAKNLKRISKLLINYWVVLILFVSIGFLMGKTDEFPSSVNKFLLNFFGLSNSYNGAWWFLQIYIIFVLLSPFIIKLVKRYSSMVLLCASGVIYLLSYIQRFKGIVDFGDHEIILGIMKTSVLFGTSQFSFVVGAIFAKEMIYSKIYNRCYNIKFKNTLCLTGILMLIIFHAVIQSAIIAPLNGIAFVCLFSLMNKSDLILKPLNFISNHSTNIWLTHMFFYMTIFTEITFAPNYPILIFLWLITLCLISSYIIKLLCNPLVKIIDRKEIITMHSKRVMNI